MWPSPNATYSCICRASERRKSVSRSARCQKDSFKAAAVRVHFGPLLCDG